MGVQWLHDIFAWYEAPSMTASTLDAMHYQLEEGHLCVDFVNTATIQVDPTAPHGYHLSEDQLTDLAALGRWGEQVGALAADEVAVLAAQPPGATHDRL